MIQTNDEIRGSIFTYLADLFKKVNVTCVLVGGYALNVNKIQRTTFDIDFITSKEDFSKIEPDLISQGYSIYNRQDGFIQLKSSKLGYKDIDFLITNQFTLDKLMTDGKQQSIGNRLFTVASPMHLLAMKLHSIAGNQDRFYKDFPDIINLCDLPEVIAQKELVKELFEKHKMSHLLSKTNLDSK
jgi:hypothetical protein